MDSTDVMDEKDIGPDVQINFPESVMSRIEELMGETEQFDNADFSAVAYINRMFPTEQSLSGVEAAAARCEWRLQEAARGLQEAVQGAASGGGVAGAGGGARAAGGAALRSARGDIAHLATQVSDINILASRSAAAVREITQEIKQLDRAKTNLTAAITALNHYHMLCGGVAALESLTTQRVYHDILPPLQAVTEVLDHFSKYRDIASLNQLRERVADIRRDLATQIHADLKEAFTGGGNKSVSMRQVSAACVVLDALDPRANTAFLAWFIHQQLQEYVHLFGPGEEVSWLPHVEQRYSWLKKHLLALEQRVLQVLPPAWRISERIATAFCRITHGQLSEVLASRRSSLDVKLLLHALQKTNNFEILLTKRFLGPDAVTEPGQSAVTTSTETQQDPDIYTCWMGAISSCFEPHLPLYISSLEQNLTALMDRLLLEAKSLTAASSTSSTSGGAVLASCADLFLLYKKCLVQCAQLTTGEPMLQLCGVFRHHLATYARGVLGGALPGGAGGLTGGAGGRLPLGGLLKDDTVTRLTKAEVSTVCQVITTAEYCLETTVHLELKMKEKIQAHLADRIDFTQEQDLFHKMISNCIQLLVQDLETSCEPALAAMTRVSWLHYDTVGDQSSYVTQIIMHLNNAVPLLRDNLASSRKYFTQFCIRFANSFIPKFIQNIYKCKPISTVGSEQLLLDTHMLKTALLEVPSIGSEVKRQAPHTYTKVVIKLMTKAEMILKLVMAPLEGAESFVCQFVQLVPESSPQEFRRVLEMKGGRLSRAQAAELDALYREHAQASFINVQGIK